MCGIVALRIEKYFREGKQIHRVGFFRAWVPCVTQDPAWLDFFLVVLFSPPEADTTPVSLFVPHFFHSDAFTAVFVHLFLRGHKKVWGSVKACIEQMLGPYIQLITHQAVKIMMMWLGYSTCFRKSIFLTRFLTFAGSGQIWRLDYKAVLSLETDRRFGFL